MLQHFIGVWFSQFSYCRLNPSRSPDFKSTRPPANPSLFRYCWQTPWLWDSKIAIHHIQEETATEDRIFIMNLAIVYKLYLGIKNIRFEESLSYSSIVPRRENNIKGIHWLWTSKWNRKAATHGFPIASSIPYQSVTSRLETSRYRDFSQFFESIGLGLENFGLEKKSRYRSRKYLVSKKSLGIGLKNI